MADELSISAARADQHIVVNRSYSWRGRVASRPAHWRDEGVSYRSVCFAAGSGLWGTCWRFLRRVTGATAAPSFTALLASALRRCSGSKLASGHAAAGRLSIRYNGVELAYRTFDKIRQVDQGAIADNKRLGPVLAMVRLGGLRYRPDL